MQPIRSAPVNQHPFMPKNALKAVARKVRTDLQLHFNRLLGQWAELKQVVLVQQQEKVVQKAQRLQILEGILDHIEKHFPATTTGAANLDTVARAVEIAANTNPIARFFLGRVRTIITDLKRSDADIAERFLRDVVLNKQSYKNLRTRHGLEVIDDKELVPTKKSIHEALSDKVQARGKTEVLVWADPECEYGFIISIGWHDSRSDDVEIEHVEIQVGYKESRYFLDCSQGTYMNRPGRHGLEKEVAHIGNELLLLGHQMAHIQTFPRVAYVNRGDQKSVATRCDALFKQVVPEKMKGINVNPVYVIEAVGAVFKEVDNRNEVRAQRVCAWLSMPEALVPACAMKLTGLEDSSGRIKVYHGVVKPLLRNHIIVKELFSKTIAQDRVAQIFHRLDLSDTQKKAAVQALLAAWDLHAANGSFVEVGAGFRVALFDNEYTLGGEKENLKGSGNLLIHLGGRFVLPVRSFFLALPFSSREPLRDDMQNWIRGLRRNREDIVKAAFSGHHLLWSRFSQETVAELQHELQATNFFQSDDPALLPYWLLQQIARDLDVSSKKWGLEQKNVPEKQRWIGWVDQLLAWNLTPQHHIRCRPDRDQPIRLNLPSCQKLDDTVLDLLHPQSVRRPSDLLSGFLVPPLLQLLHFQTLAAHVEIEIIKS